MYDVLDGQHPNVGREGPPTSGCPWGRRLARQRATSSAYCWPNPSGQHCPRDLSPCSSPASARRQVPLRYWAATSGFLRRWAGCWIRSRNLPISARTRRRRANAPGGVLTCALTAMWSLRVLPNPLELRLSPPAALCDGRRSRIAPQRRGSRRPTPAIPRGRRDLGAADSPQRPQMLRRRVRMSCDS
jgi:hypothetical protein